MKKNTFKKISMILLSMVILGSAAACSAASEEYGAGNQRGRLGEPSVSVENEAIGNQNGRNGNTEELTEVREEHLDLIIAGDVELSDAEIEGLLYMREEEKLAGDVYRYLFEQWGSAVFENIAASEDTHTDSVLALLNAYGIADPALNEGGKFSNPDLQALYDQLTAQGSQSLQDAFFVGAAIEEIDILDLEAHITETENTDIIPVYENLESGSENHLRAFVRVLANQTGASYNPQYLSQEQYDAIISSVNGAGANIGGQNIDGFGQGNGRGRNF